MHRNFAHEQARHEACSTEANEYFPHELQALGERESDLRAQGLLQCGNLRDNRVCEWGALGEELDEGGGKALAKFVLKSSVSNGDTPDLKSRQGVGLRNNGERRQRGRTLAKARMKANSAIDRAFSETGRGDWTGNCATAYTSLQRHTAYAQLSMFMVKKLR